MRVCRTCGELKVPAQNGRQCRDCRNRRRRGEPPLNQDKRLCTRCETLKPRGEFIGQPYCRPCRSEYKRERKYGLVRPTFEAMVWLQDNRCLVCDQSFDDVQLAVDHCHDTGAVRGLLCIPCNVGIGNLADDADRVRAAARYLEVYA